MCGIKWNSASIQPFNFLVVTYHRSLWSLYFLSGREASHHNLWLFCYRSSEWEGRDGGEGSLGFLVLWGGEEGGKPQFLEALRGREEEGGREAITPYGPCGREGGSFLGRGKPSIPQVSWCSEWERRDKGRLSAFQWFVLSLSDVLVASILKVLAYFPKHNIS